MALSLKNVTFQYDETKPAVLDDICLEIEPGKVTAIVGPSGCGKSTLANVMSGVIPGLISSGVVSGSLSVDKEALISVVSQSPENQLFGYGVEDALVFGVENLGLAQESIAERLEYVHDLLNIQHLRKRSVATLSGGQRQAVCIASVLAMQPDILLLDEPVSSLDPRGKSMIRTILGSLKDAGQTVVIFDNNLEWSSDIIDQVVGLEAGKVVFAGNKDSFLANAGLVKRLAVTVPQEIEIYQALAGKIKDLDYFDTIAAAKDELARYLKPATGSPEEEPAAGEAILAAHGLGKQFADGFNALIDVDVDFNKGRIIAILGQNGSGKTTLVKHLNGLYRPTKGKVEFRGQNIAGRSVAQISKDVILVFQNPELMLFEENVYAELVFSAKAQNVPFSEEEALAILEEYGLAEERDEFPVNLSMGKKHLLTILSVLLSSAEVIILDEPTLGMDQNLKQQLLAIMASLKAAGKTVILISHEIPLVFQVADEIIVLNDGRKLEQGSRARLAASPKLFEQINISLPPAVQLARYFGLPDDCCDTASLVSGIEKRLARPAAGGG